MMRAEEKGSRHRQRKMPSPCRSVHWLGDQFCAFLAIVVSVVKRSLKLRVFLFTSTIAFFLLLPVLISFFCSVSALETYTC